MALFSVCAFRAGHRESCIFQCQPNGICVAKVVNLERMTPHGTPVLWIVCLHCSLCLRKNHSIDGQEHLSADSILCKQMQHGYTSLLCLAVHRCLIVVSLSLVMGAASVV
jgi:hypothetical protein